MITSQKDVDEPLILFFYDVSENSLIIFWQKNLPKFPHVCIKNSSFGLYYYYFYSLDLHRDSYTYITYIQTDHTECNANK